MLQKDMLIIDGQVVQNIVERFGKTGLAGEDEGSGKGMTRKTVAG